MVQFGARRQTIIHYHGANQLCRRQISSRTLNASANRYTIVDYYETEILPISPVISSDVP